MQRNWKFNGLVVALVGGLLLFGCSKSPIEPAPEENNSESFEKVAASNGVEVFRSMQTLDQIDQALAGPESLGEIKVPAVGSLSGSGARFSRVLAPFHQQAPKLAARLRGLHKVQGDTLLFEARWTDPATGIDYHSWISYNTDNGKATVIIVATNHPSASPLDRDSTRAVIDLNFTLEDTTDDVIELLENAKDYRPGYRLQFEHGRIIPDAYQPGTEPTGGVLEGLSVYSPGQDTTRVSSRLEYHEVAQPWGSWSQTVEFEDGTRASEDISFTETRVTFNLNRRDGTREQGHFEVPDENHLSFEKTVTYPAGSDPRSLHETGEYARNPADSSASASFTREVIRADGTSERSTFAITESRQNGYRRVTVTATNPDGTGGSWTLQEGASQDELTGSWIDKQGHYVLFNGTFFHDGSGDIHLEVYASKQAYDNGESPIFTADLHFDPEGSGSGAVTSNDGTSQFSFAANGNPFGSGN